MTDQPATVITVFCCSRCWNDGQVVARIPDDCTTTRREGNATVHLCPAGHVVWVIGDEGALDIGIVRAETEGAENDLAVFAERFESVVELPLARVEISNPDPAVVKMLTGYTDEQLACDHPALTMTNRCELCGVQIGPGLFGVADVDGSEL